jgi:MinD-like ATPase involved in chromosome partitioning or flagellar assembly
VARHDREESLEEQLAWLDAIKESEEAPVKVSAKTGPVAPQEETVVVSPYPQDPWALVPQHDTPTPPLFRAAVDSVYGGPAPAETAPAEPESETTEQADDSAETKPAIDDAFLAPLRPLPRQEDAEEPAPSPPPSPGSSSAPEPERPEETTEENLPWPVPPTWAGGEPETASSWAGGEAAPASSWPGGEPQPAPAFPEPPQRTFDEPSPPFAEPSQRAFSGEARTFDDHLRLQEPPPAPPAEQPSMEQPSMEQPSVKEAPVEEAPRPEPRHHRPAPAPVFNAPVRPPVTGRPTAESLDPDVLLRGRRDGPSKGWRRLVYKASGGLIKPGEPPEVKRRLALIARARTPVATGHHRVAVLSLKGGVGKTTTTVGLGATLASIRGDRVIAVDANPDRGTLSDKLKLETSATVRDLLNERDQVKRYVDIRAFTSQAPSRLEVLASDRDPSVSEAFSGSDYQAVAQVLENFYSICITDCGTGLLHSAMGGVLGLADQIVLVSSPSVDGARAASATLDWLEAHHYENLVRDATVVLCSVRPRSKSAVDINKLEGHFAARCRAVVRVPYDPHLEEGAEIDLDRLQEATRDAYLQLAANVGDGFAAT